MEQLAIQFISNYNAYLALFNSGALPTPSVPIEAAEQAINRYPELAAAVHAAVHIEPVTTAAKYAYYCAFQALYATIANAAHSAAAELGFIGE